MTVTPPTCFGGFEQGVAGERAGGCALGELLFGGGDVGLDRGDTLGNDERGDREQLGRFGEGVLHVFVRWFSRPRLASLRRALACSAGAPPPASCFFRFAGVGLEREDSFGDGEGRDAEELG